MDEEERKKFEMEENGEKEGKKRLDKEALCERLIWDNSCDIFFSFSVMMPKIVYLMKLLPFHVAIKINLAE